MGYDTSTPIIYQRVHVFFHINYEAYTHPTSLNCTIIVSCTSKSTAHFETNRWTLIFLWVKNMLEPPFFPPLLAPFAEARHMEQPDDGLEMLQVGDLGLVPQTRWFVVENDF